MAEWPKRALDAGHGPQDWASSLRYTFTKKHCPQADSSGGFMEGLFQPMHLLVIFFIALLFFGPRKLPELGKGLGEGFRALRDGMKDSAAKPETAAQAKTDADPEKKA
jgi:sec-independent protein translocase protein TatA